MEVPPRLSKSASQHCKTRADSTASESSVGGVPAGETARSRTVGGRLESLGVDTPLIRVAPRAIDCTCLGPFGYSTKTFGYRAAENRVVNGGRRARTRGRRHDGT